MLLVAAVGLGGCEASEPVANLARFSFTAPAMGTEFRIVLYADDSTRAAAAAGDAFDLAESLEEIMSDYLPESELNRLSATSAEGRFVPVSEPLLRVLLEAVEVSEASGGAFDVTSGALTRLWRRGIRRGSVPDEASIIAARQAVGYRDMSVDSSAGAVRLGRADMRLDLGGIAKGFAADRMLDCLHADGFAVALVDAGGDIAAGDPPPGSGGWRVLLADSTHKIIISNAGIATSGDAVRFLEADDRRYSHIVDPITGYGTTHTHSVTVIASSATTADAFASAFAVMPAAEAISLAESLGNLEARILSWSDSASAPVLLKTTGFPIP